MKSMRDVREDQIAQEAIEWLKRLESPTPENKEAFAEWITRSPDHVHQFLLATAVSEELSQALGYGALGGIAVAVDARVDPNPLDNQPPAAASNVEVERIAHAVGRLPKHCRRVFTLRKVYGCSQQEIASRLDLTEEAVEHQLGQAARRLARMLSMS